MKRYYIYILANNYPMLYVGMTNNLVRRVYEHKQGLVPGFTMKYNLKKLVYFEEFNIPTEAITREKRLKHWRRAWKLDLIKKSNPNLRDLYSDIAT